MKYDFICNTCLAPKSILRKMEPALDFSMKCPECEEGVMLRAPSSVTSRMTETLDNGLMTRRIERPANAENLYKERERQADAAKFVL